VRDLVAEAGFGERLAFDFGLMQDLSYYSGLIVEAYAPGVGLPVATGGRYDGLLERFDWDVPGVGFAIAVDRAADALDEAGVELPGAQPAIPFIGGLEAPARAAELRSAGLAIRALPEGVTGVEPPLVLRHGGSFTLRLADGREVHGGAGEIAEALGAG
jgi:ATP phosphoribosyltransferase regulatory subunit